MRIRQLARVLAVGLGLCFGHAALGQATTFTDGQKIEVREGDSWSAASIVKKEGRKYLVHYDGAEATADEWVTPDRIRAATARRGPHRASDCAGRRRRSDHAPGRHLDKRPERPGQVGRHMA